MSIGKQITERLRRLADGDQAVLEAGTANTLLVLDAPLREGDAVTYWEVTLWAGDEPGARAVRYQWSPGMAEHEVLAYPATFALIARMADGLAAALRSDVA